MNIDEYTKDLKVLTTEEMYNKYIISGDIWYFKNKYGNVWFEKYDEFKLFISNKLDVHYNDIALAGSGKLGFSLNPIKNFKLFDENSDLDIIIISQKYFYYFWDAYRKDSYAEIKMNNFNKVCFSIFRKYLTLDGFSTTNESYIRWLKKTQGFEKDLQLIFGIDNELHYRIFESWDSAKDYYMSSIAKTRKRMEDE